MMPAIDYSTVILKNLDMNSKICLISREDLIGSILDKLIYRNVFNSVDDSALYCPGSGMKSTTYKGLTLKVEYSEHLNKVGSYKSKICYEMLGIIS